VLWSKDLNLHYEDIQLEDTKKEVIYAVNLDVKFLDILPKCFKVKDNIFDNKENLRLTILSHIKDMEGYGVANTNF